MSTNIFIMTLCCLNFSSSICVYRLLSKQLWVRDIVKKLAANDRKIGPIKPPPSSSIENNFNDLKNIKKYYIYKKQKNNITQPKCQKNTF